MDLQLSAEEERYRNELVAWLDTVDRPPGLRDFGATPTAYDVEPGRAWQRLLFEAGRAGLSWPVEHGGVGASVIQQAIFAEEAAKANVPRQLSFVSTELAGPIIIAFGTDAQRARFLAPILRGDDVWCQLFSEPVAGSDLAGLQTRAVPVQRGWTVTGQKVWTSGAHYADLGLLLARTDPDVPRHQGLSCFLVPMDRAGIEVRPLRQMDGDAKFNEVFLDGVAVGPEDLLGEPGQGWSVAVSTLGRERLLLGAQAVGLLDQLERMSAVGIPSGSAPVVRQRWAELRGRVHLLRLTWLRAVSDGDQAASSVLKLAASELQRDVSRLAADVLGPHIQAGPDGRDLGQRLLAAPGATLAGGTSEIQRNILAERVLGLPREPKG